MNTDMHALVERSADLLTHLEKLEAKRNAPNGSISLFQVNDLAARSAQLISSVTGAKSVYSENMRNAQRQKGIIPQYFAIGGVLQAFHLDLASGHLANLRHEAETVVVSEILSQARMLIKTKGVHAAAAVIVACAGVEEFLRSWCSVKVGEVPEKQRSLSKFANELRTANEIDLPVERRILSWADYRNDAAHGANWGKITPEIANRVLREIDEFVLEHRHVLG
ncbi:hypothetical protein [Paraburkholderia graminis]|uniref:hypothetical protein n=1 Tax=Paraburkholderia graminis TaxID=60548 RepID=UPI0038BA1323